MQLNNSCRLVLTAKLERFRMTLPVSLPANRWIFRIIADWESNPTKSPVCYKQPREPAGSRGFGNRKLPWNAENQSGNFRVLLYFLGLLYAQARITVPRTFLPRRASRTLPGTAPLTIMVSVPLRFACASICPTLVSIPPVTSTLAEPLRDFLTF